MSSSNRPDRQYAIETIVTHQILNGERYFFIKWHGYPSSENTWEPEDGMEQTAGEAIKDYESRIQQPDNRLHEVERIVSHTTMNGRRRFRVKWRGYPTSQNTWEPEESLQLHAGEAIETYIANHNHNNTSNNSSMRNISITINNSSNNDNGSTSSPTPTPRPRQRRTINRKRNFSEMSIATDNHRIGYERPKKRQKLDKREVDIGEEMRDDDEKRDNESDYYEKATSTVSFSKKTNSYGRWVNQLTIPDSMTERLNRVVRSGDLKDMLDFETGEDMAELMNIDVNETVNRWNLNKIIRCISEFRRECGRFDDWLEENELDSLTLFFRESGIYTKATLKYVLENEVGVVLYDSVSRTSGLKKELMLNNARLLNANLR